MLRQRHRSHWRVHPDKKPPTVGYGSMLFSLIFFLGGFWSLWMAIYPDDDNLKLPILRGIISSSFMYRRTFYGYCKRL